MAIVTLAPGFQRHSSRARHPTSGSGLHVHMYVHVCSFTGTLCHLQGQSFRLKPGPSHLHHHAPHPPHLCFSGKGVTVPKHIDLFLTSSLSSSVSLSFVRALIKICSLHLCPAELCLVHAALAGLLLGQRKGFPLRLFYFGLFVSVLGLKARGHFPLAPPSLLTALRG